jgi:hypothetical protein
VDYYQLLSAAERDEILAAHLRERLPAFGLTEITARRWVDGSQPPVKRMFELQLLKGASIGACWGFSLDYVPHISGGRVRWHRSDKTVMLDIIVDQRDLPQPSYIRGPAGLTEGLRQLLPEAIRRAGESWRKGSTLQGMLGIIREIPDRRSNCLGYENYTQMPLAYAFLSAKIGDVQTALQKLEEYVKRLDLDDDGAARLKKLTREYAA